MDRLYRYEWDNLLNVIHLIPEHIWPLVYFHEKTFLLHLIISNFYYFWGWHKHQGEGVCFKPKAQYGICIAYHMVRLILRGRGPKHQPPPLLQEQIGEDVIQCQSTCWWWQYLQHKGLYESAFEVAASCLYAGRWDYHCVMMNLPLISPEEAESQVTTTTTTTMHLHFAPSPGSNFHGTRRIVSRYLWILPHMKDERRAH